MNKTYYYGMFREGQMHRKEEMQMDQGGVSGKTERMGGKKGQSCVSKVLASVHVWPSPVLDCLSLACYSTLFSPPIFSCECADQQRASCQARW